MSEEPLARSVKLVVRRGLDEGREILISAVGEAVTIAEVNRPPFTLNQHLDLIIGRGFKADIRLLDNTVSQRHCALRLSLPVLTIEDLGSGNGTKVNGQRVVSQPVDRPVALELGNTELEVIPVAQAAAGAAQMEAALQVTVRRTTPTALRSKPGEGAPDGAPASDPAASETLKDAAAPKPRRPLPPPRPPPRAP
jgi:hypothetical protein